MRIFLTGGSGFIGHWVVKELLERGHSLRLLVRNKGKIPSLGTLPGVELIEGTLDDHPAIERGLAGCEACVHIALGWGETPTTMLEKDTAATVFLLEAAEKAGVERFLYTSSTATLTAAVALQYPWTLVDFGGRSQTAKLRQLPAK